MFNGTHTWTKRCDAPLPAASTHTFSRPPISEALTLLPLAYRLKCYQREEIVDKRKKGTIFDLNGLTLDPPKPGPFGGVPCGGVGTGAIGRSYLGEFNSFSIIPGKYKHHKVTANQFSVRLKRNGIIYSQVLSTLPSTAVSPGLSSWKWEISPSDVTYHGLFPQSWHVYESADSLPGLRIVINQISPFLPHNYSESSLPTTIFEVEVTNNGGSNSDEEDVEVSVMFTFANDIGAENSETYDLIHCPFSCNISSDDINNTYSSKQEEAGTADTDRIVGVCMANQVQNTCDGLSYRDPCSISISTTASRSGMVTYCNGFATERRADSALGNDISSTLTNIYGKCVNGFLQGLGREDPMLTKGRILWDNFTATGDISGVESLEEYKNGSVIASTYNAATALCIRKTIPKQQKRVYTFALSWDCPVARFGDGGSVTRYYSQFFSGSNNAGLASASISIYALLRYKHWQLEINNWQQEVLQKARHGARDELPEYYSHQLFNELYYLVDGGSIWASATPTISSDVYPYDITEVSKAINKDVLRMSLLSLVPTMAVHNEVVQGCGGLKDVVGQFLYLEGHEYLMYNTYDVHFYASFALLMLFPMIELSLQRDISATVPQEDLSTRPLLSTGVFTARKVMNCIAHDVGSPFEQPWTKCNAYNLQDTTKWKDLGSKYVLQVYRDYCYLAETLTGTGIAESLLRFLTDLYPTILLVMKSLEQFDPENDGMIRNQGFPDQTYDVWTASGIHAYCGGLYIAAMDATAAIAKLLNDTVTHEYYTVRSQKGRVVYVTALWNGKYLNYDSSAQPHHDSIMSDMLAGQLYSYCCDLPPVVSHDIAQSCLQHIYEYNVVKYSAYAACNQGSNTGFNKQHTYIGCVNGMRPDGTVDNTCIQSREVWTGTTYTTAATMIFESKFSTQVAAVAAADDILASELDSPVVDPLPNNDMLKKGFATAKGIHDGGWDLFGYQFATPEAYEASGNYRSLGYMRALAIWSIQYSLEKKI